MFVAPEKEKDNGGLVITNLQYLNKLLPVYTVFSAVMQGIRLWISSHCKTAGKPELQRIT